MRATSRTRSTCSGAAHWTSVSTPAAALCSCPPGKSGDGQRAGRLSRSAVARGGESSMAAILRVIAKCGAALVIAVGLASCAATGSAAPNPRQADDKKAPAAASRIPAPFDLEPYPSTYRPLPRTDTLITNATVLDGVGHRFDDSDVHLKDGQVIRV